MPLAHSIFKFIARQFHIPADALDYFLASGSLGRPAETALPFPAELIPIGARLVLRGWQNHKFLPTNRDWILPYWAERQFDPTDPAFLPRGFNLYTINYTHRDWTMLGNVQREREALVDPRGLVTPWFDGWSLDVWCAVDGKFYAPSRLPASQVEQSLHENLPIVVTAFSAGDVRVQSEAFAFEHDAQEFVAENITLTNTTRNPQHATLYLAVRPLNPEGVSLVNDVEYQPSAVSHQPSAIILVNHAPGVYLPQPDAIACSNFENGDVALALPNLNGATKIHCPAGLATAVAAYHIDLNAGASQSLSIAMPMAREEIEQENPKSQKPNLNLQSSIFNLRTQTISDWQAHLNRGMRVRLPDEKMQAAFDANKAYLLLAHDGDTITPGPWTYHQFWLRDAAYMLNALDKMGYHSEAQQVLEKIPRRLQKDGYLQATEGEWDSNGAALWSFAEHARLTGDLDLLARHYWSLLRMASWINSKRRQTTDNRRQTAHHGLLPPGMSAEHLGPSDYFYWDDFWGLAGLRDMAQTAEWLGVKSDAEKLRANFLSFKNAVDASLAQVAQKIGRAAIPASPYRRLDSAMIGSLAALYPLRLFDANDPRIVDTLAALREVAWLEDTFFNHVGHSAFGTYLALHAAQCLLQQRDPAAWKIIAWVLRHASPTFTWAEGIHPITRGGAMGDGHHGWAIADWLLIVRNSLLLEENDRLIITAALLPEWTTEMNVIQVEDAPTYFGKVNFTIAFGERTGTLAINGDWRDDSLKYIEWTLPFPLKQVGGETEGIEMIDRTVRLPRHARRVVVMW